MSDVKTEAKISGNGLVVSIADKAGPRVWRCDTARLDNCAFELGTEGALTTLVMKSAQSRETIHAFSDRAAAADALQAVSRALLNAPSAPGAGVAAVMMPATPGGGFLRKIFKFLFTLLIIFVCLVFLTVMIKPGGMRAPAPDAVKTGVPVPADELLGGE